MDWGRMTQGSYLRVFLLAVLAVCVLEYVWVETQSGRPSRGSGGLFLGDLSTAACPAPGQTGQYGEMDYSWTLTSLDGAEVPLEQFRDQVVFLNLWATWCGPCVMEMPSIQALHGAMKEEGVAFVLVSEEDTETVQNFVTRRGFTFPVYVAKKMPTVFDARGVPTTFIAGRDGRIVWKHTGAADWNSDSCQTLLRSLVKSPATSLTTRYRSN